MHQWDEVMTARLERLVKANGTPPLKHGLTHALIFYTAGEAVRTIVSGHRPYAEGAGIWQRSLGAFKPALDAHWKPYLDGKSTLDAALVGLLKS